MRIKNLTSGESKTYTCNVYLVQGEWDSIDDVNTLIDVGTDLLIIPKIKDTLKGIGKKKIDQVLLTHGDFDHVGILSEIKAVFNPIVYAGSNLQQSTLGDALYIYSFQMMFIMLWFKDAEKVKNRRAGCIGNGVEIALFRRVPVKSGRNFRDILKL